MSASESASTIASFEKATGLGLTLLGLSIVICRIWKTAGERMEMVQVQRA